MKNKFNTIEKKLFELTEATENEDTLKYIVAIAVNLHDIRGEIEDSDGGAGLEISEWAGLKIDSPELAKDYGEGIRKDFPELFED